MAGDINKLIVYKTNYWKISLKYIKNLNIKYIFSLNINYRILEKWVIRYPILFYFRD